MREIKLLKRLERVENVVKLLDICTCQDESVYLVMEYLEYDLVGLQHYISLSVPSINVPVESSNSSNHHRNDGLSNHSHVRSSDTNFVDDSLSILKSSHSNSSNKIFKTNLSPKNSSYIGLIKCILKQTLTARRDLHEHDLFIVTLKAPISSSINRELSNLQILD